ncbi:MAG TPA: DUF6290 family protein [Candidatus Saccharimonadales bacterium]|nr:DUF6290 family protein [Candidatus Saccharimonadales bacterium]
MKSVNEKTTIYIDPRIKRSVQYYALRDARSLSAIINEKLFEYLEDMADIAAIKEARKEKDEFIPFEQAVKELGLNLDEIRSEAKAERKQTAKKA